MSPSQTASTPGGNGTGGRLVGPEAELRLVDGELLGSDRRRDGGRRLDWSSGAPGGRDEARPRRAGGAVT
ncbi:hypothetical protein [Kutzneria sp. NPDC051319]|uniref:hypothetical protein n=1 Tax=Kutzneria sp. NPDC051319 TaxID=3155047 RepID=UPI003437E650